MKSVGRSIARVPTFFFLPASSSYPINKSTDDGTSPLIRPKERKGKRNDRGNLVDEGKIYRGCDNNRTILPPFSFRRQVEIGSRFSLRSFTGKWMKRFRKRACPSRVLRSRNYFVPPFHYRFHHPPNKCYVTPVTSIALKASSLGSVPEPFISPHRTTVRQTDSTLSSLNRHRLFSRKQGYETSNYRLVIMYNPRVT